MSAINSGGQDRSRSSPYNVIVIVTKTVSHSRVDYCFVAGWVSGGLSVGFSYVEGMPRFFLRYPYMVGTQSSRSVNVFPAISID